MSTRSTIQFSKAGLYFIKAHAAVYVSTTYSILNIVKYDSSNALIDQLAFCYINTSDMGTLVQYGGRFECCTVCHFDKNDKAQPLVDSGISSSIGGTVACRLYTVPIFYDL